MYLKIENIKKIFEKDKGIKNISLDVNKGELITLLGPSGCGKTTLLNVLGGFIKPDEGKILIEEEEITNLYPEERPITTIFQNYALFPHMNVIENISYGLKYTSLSKKEQLEEALKYLKIVGLEGYEKVLIQNLSGGQQQRIAIARAMVLKPKLLLLDEPFSNLDAKLKIAMREELKTLQRKLKITMVLVTHDQEEALSLSDRVVVMNNGEIVQTGTPEEVYYNPINEYVASFIGKVNFFNSYDQKIIRPENIVIEHDESGEWKVIGKEFMGSYTIFFIENKNKVLMSQIFGNEAQKFFIGDKVVYSIK